MREEHQQLGVSVRHVARVRELYGQSDILHDIQQSVPASVQKGAAVQVQEPDLATPQMTGQSEKGSTPINRDSDLNMCVYLIKLMKEYFKYLYKEVCI